jgi:hypothetical protein
MVSCDLSSFLARGIEGLSRRRSGRVLMHGVGGPPSATGGIVQKRGDKIARGRVWGSHAMSQREVVWILMAAVLIAAAGVGAFVVVTYALSLF